MELEFRGRDLFNSTEPEAYVFGSRKLHSKADRDQCCRKFYINKMELYNSDRNVFADPDCCVFGIPNFWKYAPECNLY